MRSFVSAGRWNKQVKILQSTSLWRSVGHRNHARAVGQQSHRNSVHHPYMIHQLFNSHRRWMRHDLKNPKFHATRLDVRHMFATDVVACFSLVSLKPIMSGKFIVVPRSACLVPTSDMCSSSSTLFFVSTLK